MYVLGVRLSVYKGEIPKRPTGADCKSAGKCLRRFESCSPHLKTYIAGFPFSGAGSLWTISGGSSSVGRALAFQAKGRGFEYRLPLTFFEARVAQG
jgi:hypothetical protein